MDDLPGNDPPVAAKLEIAGGIFLAPGGMRIQFARSGGPGGQNVNKLNTKAELWIRLDSIIGLNPRAKARLRVLAGSRLTLDDQIHLRAETERSQQANRQEVLDRLRQLLIAARIEPKVRRKTKPSRAANRRPREGKPHRGRTKSQRQTPGEEW